MSRLDFEIVPPGALARAFPLVLGGFFALALVVSLVVPLAGNLDYRMLLAVVPALMIAIGACALLTWAMRHPRVRLEDGTLIVGRLPRTSAHARQFDLDAARVVDLDAERALRPFVRLIGTTLPGYRSGWFRLRNGKRAYLIVTYAQRVLVLPRRDGVSVLLSVARPDALLDAMRRAA